MLVLGERNPDRRILMAGFILTPSKYPGTVAQCLFHHAPKFDESIPTPHFASMSQVFPICKPVEISSAWFEGSRICFLQCKFSMYDFHCSVICFSTRRRGWVKSTFYKRRRLNS